jgi:aspartate racemase
MTKHIGIVAGSHEGSALCYRTICMEAPEFMGDYNHPEITMHSIPLAEHMKYVSANDWDGLGQVLARSAEKLAGAGADFAICPVNTYHPAFDYATRNSPIPWIHIVDAVAAEAERLDYRSLGIMGTKSLTGGTVYQERLEKFGIVSEIPDEADREKMNRIIFDELVKGVFPEDSRLFFSEVAEKFKTDGCDAVVMGCTEIPLIVRDDDFPLPTLDSTRLLARAALTRALAE